MASEQVSISSQTFTKNGIESMTSQQGADPETSINLSSLLERCRGDLMFIDSLLGDLEKTFQPDIVGSSEEAMRIDRPDTSHPLHVMKTRIGELGAESVRRVADDIENLCRTDSVGSVNDMLGDLHCQMVRCLRLLPANNRQPD